MLAWQKLRGLSASINSFGLAFAMFGNTPYITLAALHKNHKHLRVQQGNVLCKPRTSWAETPHQKSNSSVIASDLHFLERIKMLRRK